LAKNLRELLKSYLIHVRDILLLKIILESRKLTDEAVSACHLIGINPSDLYEKYNEFNFKL